VDNELQKKIIDRIVAEVLYRIKAAEPKSAPPKGTVVIVSSFVPAFDKVQESIKSNFGTEDIQYFTVGGAKVPSKLEQVTDADEAGGEKVLNIVSGAKNVVILTPKIKLLERIAAGDDSGFVEYLTTRSLLWGKNVSLLLDFEPPTFRRNTFCERIADALGVLEEIGIQVITYSCANEESTSLALVTENDVVCAYKTGSTEVRTLAGAIITPSAADKAKELGIAIN
jgi:hypothetical protein